jgi:hypothetical protein
MNITIIVESVIKKAAIPIDPELNSLADNTEKPRSNVMPARAIDLRPRQKK